jgi:hypothetical protein
MKFLFTLIYFCLILSGCGEVKDAIQESDTQEEKEREASKNEDYNSELNLTSSLFLNNLEMTLYDHAINSKGEIILAGRTGTSSDDDAFIMKINKTGDVIWTNQINQFTSSLVLSPSYNQNVCNTVKIDNDDNIYCAGSVGFNFSEQNGSSDTIGSAGSDPAIMKLNTNGEILWVRQFGKISIEDASLGMSDKGDGFSYFTLDANGNVYGVGGTRSELADVNTDESIDLFYAKILPNGEISWIKQFGETNTILEATSHYGVTSRNIIYSDNELIITAISAFHDGIDESADIVVINTDLDGNVLWHKRYADINSSEFSWGSSYDRDILENTKIHGDYIYLSGFIQNWEPLSFNGFIIKIDKSNGNLLWDFMIPEGSVCYDLLIRKDTVNCPMNIINNENGSELGTKMITLDQSGNFDSFSEINIPDGSSTNFSSENISPYGHSDFIISGGNQVLLINVD